MEKHRITFSGSNIVDKHTHDEVYPFVGSEKTTVIIPGYIYDYFKKKYNGQLRDYKITVDIEYIPNGERVEGCQSIYKGSRYLIGTLCSLDGMLIEKEK
ncbi:MAG: hypothetical protein Q8R18_03860 [bacterium]|nr:hypothetical protein [bacterium]